MAQGYDVLAVVGPTATGKSALAVELARRLGGEVVNADASQLYRGLDIGTAKLTLDERRGVPHHQLDVLDLCDEASVASYQHNARADLQGVAQRGRLGVVAGGSGLYVRAVLDVLTIPPTDAAVRARYEARCQAEGSPTLHRELADQDPEAAAAILPTNARRVVRALEVMELTGQRFSATMPRREFVQPTLMVGLRAPRDVLDARIARRVDRMWAQGWADEVRGLLAEGLRESRTASKTLGYPQVMGYLDGVLSRDEATAATVAATMRLVRRQESWFRPDPRIWWLDAPSGEDQVEALAEQVMQRWESGRR